MKQKKRLHGSPVFDDIDRLAENLESNYPNLIIDPDSLEKNLKNYFERESQDPEPFLIQARKNKLLTQILYKRGGGQRFRKDVEQTAKTTYPNTSDGREAYMEKGAGKSDLDGVDTRQGRKISKKKLSKTYIRQENLTFVGRVKKQTVKARKETIKVKNKDVTRYRDRKGRFVKVRHK